MTRSSFSLCQLSPLMTRALSTAFLILPLVTGCPGETPGASDAGNEPAPTAEDAGDNGNEDDGGAPLVSDAGQEPEPAEAGIADDGGTPLPPRDSGPENRDAGNPPVIDAGVAPQDSGTFFDAGTPPVQDAGPIVVVDPPATAEAACIEATAVEQGVAVRGDTTDFPDFFSSSCVTRGSHEQIFVYTSTSALSVVTASVRDEDGADLTVSLRTDCSDEDSELACSDDRAGNATETAGIVYVPAGTDVFIFVDGYNADDYGPFSLTVEETEIPVLGEGDLCDPTAVNEEPVCDPDVANMDCLLVSGENVCAVQTILLRGDSCSPDDTATICDDARDEECIDYGLGSFFCDNRVLAKCEQALPINGNTSATRTAVYDDVSGSCGGGFSAEAAFTYTVLQDRANLTIIGDEDVDVVHVRQDCSDRSSEFDCSSTNKVDLFNVRQGETFTIFGESGVDKDVTFTVTETTLTLLPTDALCIPDDTDTVCNFERDLDCLVVQGENRCVELTILPSGDLCNPDDTGVVCDVNDGYLCIDDGAGDNRCLNPAVQQCLTPTLLPAGSFATGLLTADVTNGSCGGSTSKEAAFSYVVQTANAKVTFLSPSNPDTIYVRSDCADPASELACSSSNQVVFGGAVGGETLTVFVEKSSGADVALFAFEQEIVVLAEGDACDPDSDTTICDSRLNHLCLDFDGLGDKCFDTTVNNDTCETATLLTGSGGTVGGDLTYATDDYDADELGDCTGYGSSGVDVVYSVTLQAGENVNAAITTEGDASILLLDSCPATATSCIAGADDTFSGDAETITYSSASGGTYFIVVDTYSGNGGIYSLEWSVQ